MSVTEEKMQDENEKIKEILKYKEGFLRIKEILEALLPDRDKKEIEELAVKMYIESAIQSSIDEERRDYAIRVLQKGVKYIQGYLKDYKIEYELKDKQYPISLSVKVYY